MGLFTRAKSRKVATYEAKAIPQPVLKYYKFKNCVKYNNITKCSIKILQN